MGRVTGWDGNWEFPLFQKLPLCPGCSAVESGSPEHSSQESQAVGITIGEASLSPCSGVSGSHSQIPESQEQVGLSILMLQNIPEGRSPEWVLFFPQEGNWVIRRSPVGLTSGVPVNTQAVSSLSGPTSMRTRKAERP